MARIKSAPRKYIRGQGRPPESQRHNPRPRPASFVTSAAQNDPSTTSIPAASSAPSTSSSLPRAEPVAHSSRTVDPSTRTSGRRQNWSTTGDAPRLWENNMVSFLLVSKAGQFLDYN